MSRLVPYRCRVAQSGANWLKLAKTESKVYGILSVFSAFYAISLRGLVVVFCSRDLKVPSSNPT